MHSILAPDIPGWSPATCCLGANFATFSDRGVKCCECERVWVLDDDGTWRHYPGTRWVVRKGD